MVNAFARKSAPALSLLERWPGPGRARALFAGGFALATAITTLAVWLVASAPRTGSIAPASRTLIIVLGLNLLLILVLAGYIGLRVARLVRRRHDDAGARLHLRFVFLFGAAAVVPAVVVALFFGVLVTRGVESWFSKDVRQSVENSATIGKNYLKDVDDQMTRDFQAMSGELAQIHPMFQNRLSFSNALTSLAEFRGYAALYLISPDGSVLARGETRTAPPYLAPPADALKQAAAAQSKGDPPVAVTENPDAVRVLFPLPGYPNTYLYVVRALQPGMVARLRNSSAEIGAYRERAEARQMVQIAFSLAYLEIALLVLVGAAWLGMRAAGQISAPVSRLVQAADRIAGGDLNARVDNENDPDEIAVLSNAFNRMTGDLQAQQEALKAASVEAVDRSRFIETVLSGVSAGVIGLDDRGRVSVVNSQAIKLLALDQTKSVLGQPLSRVAPELAEIANRSGLSTGDHDVDVTRGTETRRLRVRVSGGGEGGPVFTFDDITRLMTAQRNAAWRDVARRIAHEIKNPLTPIQLSAERLRRKYRGQVSSDLETFDRCTDTIIRQVGDIGRMVDEFSSFARMPAPNFAHENAAELLRQAVFAQRVAAPEIEVTLGDLPAEADFVADGRMVAQALTNVLKNAGESVAAKLAQDPNLKAQMSAALVVDGDTLTFVVEDAGLGLPVKDRDRLAEPYVTTREKGTGLGLAIVKRICEDHGGELLLGDAESLTGARVSLRFPRTLTAAHATSPSAHATTTA
ncbi:MAG TPA: PAS domain-containing sensor histidine kinase [Caulobacteraceae bacterium]|jgi:two-component system nitrogen regulation sensor histidine kinase NtrY|nr:PAS domain-containing sensor histidine kinase [Caulobacteraceae bacterium]